MKNECIMSLYSMFFSQMIRLTVPLKILLGSIILIISLTACAPPQPLPAGPTPIPTLIPATIPPSNIKPTEVAIQVVESYPAGLPSASSGQDLYGVHCASCHGIDGNGLVPNARNFSDVDYMRGETPADFYVIITEGRQADMPAFGEELTSDERWAVVYYVWRFSTTADILQIGHEIYQSNCVSCHGEDGRSMILGAANFSDQRFMANKSPSDLYVSVTQGQGSMPAWQARLGQDDRWAVIDYIRTFTYAPQVGEEVAISPTDSTSNESERQNALLTWSKSTPLIGIMPMRLLLAKLYTMITVQAVMARTEPAGFQESPISQIPPPKLICTMTLASTFAVLPRAIKACHNSKTSLTRKKCGNY
jgi:mono/diheme cytochrome c family protein